MIRLLFHKRFYIPALAALFFAIPGSLSPFAGATGMAAGERWESGLIVVIFFVLYSVLLICQQKMWRKAALGTFVHLFFIGLMVARIRAQFLDSLRLENFLTMSFFHACLPLFVLYYCLCQLDNYKRSWVTVGMVSFASLFLFSRAVQSRNTLGVMDWNIAESVRERQAANDFDYPQDLMDQCQRIREDKSRQKCSLLVSQAPAISDCDIMETHQERIACLVSVSQWIESKKNRYSPSEAALK